MGVSKDATRSPEDALSTPLPGETLAMFYGRSRASFSPHFSIYNSCPRSGEYWLQKVFSLSKSMDSRGKELRTEGFRLAQERYGQCSPTSPAFLLHSTERNSYMCSKAEYKPILKEVEKILSEAELDEDEMKRAAAAGGTARVLGKDGVVQS
jgi:hypothetical protein